MSRPGSRTAAPATASAATASSAASVAAATEASSLVIAPSLLLRTIRLILLLLLLERLHDLIGHPNKLNLTLQLAVNFQLRNWGTMHTHIVAPHVCLIQPEELVALGACLGHIPHDQVHPRVTR
jgi:hypothetical protein